MSATTRGRGRALMFVETAAMIRRRPGAPTCLNGADHRRTGAKLVAAAEGGVQGVHVYDLELPD